MNAVVARRVLVGTAVVVVATIGAVVAAVADRMSRPAVRR